MSQIQEHLPVLQVVIPLVAAPICVLLRKSSVVWLFALAVTWISCAISGSLLMQVLQSESGYISYMIGNWVAPLGIEYRIDAVNAFVLLIVTGVGSVVLLYAPKSVGHEIPEEHHHYLYSAFLLCMTGLLGITTTGDAFNVFVFLEISSLSSYALIALGRSRKALTAAFQYLIMGTIGGTFILIGIGFIYMKTGTLNMEDLTVRIGKLLQGNSIPPTVLISFAFIIVGMSIKLAFFPLHLWLPNAYTYAPSVVTSFIAATATKVSLYMMLRFTFSIYNIKNIPGVSKVSTIMMSLALVAIFVASTVAIYQSNIKRMLAYSSIAQIGYMVLGMSLFTAEGLTAGILHMFNHALMKAALFMALGCVFMRLGSVELKDMKGIGKQMPMTMFAFVMGGLSLIGVPLTVGFISKWHLMLAVIKSHQWPIAIMLLISSLLAVIYIWRVVEVAYFQEPEEGQVVVKEAPLSMLLPTWILIGANIYFGISTKITVTSAQQAANLLSGGTP